MGQHFTYEEMKDLETSPTSSSIDKIIILTSYFVGFCLLGYFMFGF